MCVCVCDGGGRGEERVDQASIFELNNYNNEQPAIAMMHNTGVLVPKGGFVCCMIMDDSPPLATKRQVLIINITISHYTQRRGVKRFMTGRRVVNVTHISHHCDQHTTHMFVVFCGFPIVLPSIRSTTTPPPRVLYGN